MASKVRTRGSQGQTMSIVDAHDSLRQDWDAAKQSRFRRVRNVPAAGAHADYHYRSEASFLRVMEYARDMERNDPIVGWLLALAANVTLLDGIEVQAATGNAELDKALQAEWDAWCLDPDRCDAQGERDFYAMQKHAFRQMLCDGDVIAVLTNEGTLQHFEAHRVRTPTNTSRKVVHGVLLDDKRRRLEYWVTKEDVGLQSAIKAVSDVVAYPTRDEFGDRQVVHLYNAHRFSQTRGVSALAPVFDLIGMADDIQFAKLVQQQLVSAFGVFIERTSEFTGNDGSQQLGEQQQNTRRDGSTETIENLSPGTILRGAIGEKLSGFSPNIPNQEFFTQFEMTLRLIGLNVGLPLMCVLLDGSQTNFSGWRGAFDVAKFGWKTNQDQIITQYITPIYRWFVRSQIDRNKKISQLVEQVTTDGGDPTVHVCHRPIWPYVQPLQDATTDVLKLANVLVSPQEHYLAQNKDPDRVMRETVTYNAAAIRAAQAAAAAINAEFPDGAQVSWRDLWMRPTAQGLSVSMSGGDLTPAAAKQGEPANV
ncbi:MAG: phage portal protein [Planctomycetales bacterium]|nr:phage portal protein [Planctomycetales bacterium]